jgi:hypothetical protein
MATFFVSHVTPIPNRKVMFTLIKCPPMSNFEVQPSGCKNETSQKRYVNNTESTEMETSYASIITAMLEYFQVAK